MAQNTHPEADGRRPDDFAFQCTIDLVVEIGPPARHFTATLPGWEPVLFSLNGKTFHGFREKEMRTDHRFVGRKILTTDSQSPTARDIDSHAYAILRLTREYAGAPVAQFALSKRDLRTMRTFLTA